MRFFLTFIMCLMAIPVFADEIDYDHLFDIDQQEIFPLMRELEADYKKETALYDWKYNYSWNMPKVFDSEFKGHINRFGAIEKRLNNADEESLLRDLQRMPREFYPYIGPVLHTVRGLSGKILDLPGIKETKNKFPERVAAGLSHIPNLRYVSPELYLFLMPEMFGENLNSIEYPQPINRSAKKMRGRIDPRFVHKVLAATPVENFRLNGSLAKKSDGVRNYLADSDQPLSGADVKAFTATLDGLNEFRHQGSNEIEFIMADPLINFWDKKNGVDQNVAYLKRAVNPCQSIVRKVKLIGKRNEFQKIIGAQAFGLDDWAQTCDKVLKAYRVIKAPHAYISSLKMMKTGYYEKSLERLGYTPEEIQLQKYFLHAVLQMYNTDRQDIRAVMPYREELKEKLTVIGDHYLGTPIALP
ncbi:MAG: hypothetical protein IJ852_00380 [Alphaproteobacteria bacterium]|nr:hypothetical protein [Alphaproteobacteria bacterium]